MEKFLFDLLQIIVVTRVGYSLVKLMFNSKRNGKSITRKVNKLIVNRVHYYLDNALKKQRKVLQAKKEVVYSDNVIPIRKTK